MRPEIAEVWALALESGLYDQGTGSLVVVLDENGNPSRYCCLGVLCDLANKDGVRTPLGDDKLYGWNFATNGGTLPGVVIDWAGMASDSGRYNVEDDQEILIDHNDTGDSFAEIAAIIREHAEEL